MISLTNTGRYKSNYTDRRNDYSRRSSYLPKNQPQRIKTQNCFRRFYSSDLKYIPHSFPIKEAERRFRLIEENQRLSPLIFKEYPIKPVLLPVYGVEAKVHTKHYDKSKCIENSTFEEYHLNNTGMLIYAGFEFNPADVERTFSYHKFSEQLVAFNPNSIGPDVIVDPFLKRSTATSEEAKNRIKKFEIRRIKKQINHNRKIAFPWVKSIHTEYRSLKLDAFLLPAYVRKLPRGPQILPAIGGSLIHTKSSKEYSKTKIAGIVAATTTAAAFFVPSVTIPLKIGSVALAAATAGLCTHYIQKTIQVWIRFQLDKKRKSNELFETTVDDRSREILTSIVALHSSDNTFVVNPRYYKTLKLQPGEELTLEKINAAYNTKIQNISVQEESDTTDRKIEKAKNARNTFFAVLAKQEALKDPNISKTKETSPVHSKKHHSK